MATALAEQQNLAGLGIDLVYLPDFADQFNRPGTRFKDNFSPSEHIQCQQSPNPSASYAGKWAGKEAFIKAWSTAVMPESPPLTPEQTKLHRIEILKDAHSRPYIRLDSELEELVRNSTRQHNRIKLSISHDNEYAVAICTLTV